MSIVSGSTVSSILSAKWKPYARAFGFRACRLRLPSMGASSGPVVRHGGLGARYAGAGKHDLSPGLAHETVRGDGGPADRSRGSSGSGCASLAVWHRDRAHTPVKVWHLLSHTSGEPPGTRYRYDGNAFGRLTQMIERVTGQLVRTRARQSDHPPARPDSDGTQSQRSARILVLVGVP